MSGYYTEKLAAERLRACYELAPPRVQTYLESEIRFVLDRVTPSMTVLELGCGYGRILQQLVPRVHSLVGIDTSLRSLQMAREVVVGNRPALMLVMDAARMGFRDHAFDLTICIQNGICAFAADQLSLLKEAARVTRTGGRLLFSSYSPRFWDDRLDWFERQAAHGLIGEIDHDATGDGVIVCRDGFRATTIDADGFRKLAAAIGLVAQVVEVDGSSLFCEIVIPETKMDAGTR